MPRAKRASERQTEFQVQPWQEPRHKRPRSEDAEGDACAQRVVIEDLLGQGRRAPEAPPQGAGAGTPDPAAAPPTESFQGTASLAFLPGGHVSGVLVDEATRRCVGIMAEEVEMEPECSRGQDWRLVVATIIDFGSGREWKVPLEQTGLDSARLRTVDSLHGLEEEVGRVARVGIAASALPAVEFCCETLLSDAAAEGHLCRFQPKVCGRDAVVNIGPMSVHIPGEDGGGSPVAPSPPMATEGRVRGAGGSAGPGPQEPSLWSDDEGGRGG